MSVTDFFLTLPLAVLLIWATVLLVVDLFIPKSYKGRTAFLGMLGLIVSLSLTLLQREEGAAFGGMIRADAFATFINILLLVSGLLGLLLAYGSIRRQGIERGEYYTLLLFSVGGMMLMAQASDLIVLFLGLELLSIPLYVLAAFAAPQLDSEEAGLKYFLLGAFASGFLLYGIALLYGASGTTALEGIAGALSRGHNLLFSIGAALILVGLGFKVAVVPFHMWTPDVYQGAPTAVTGFMAAGAKIAGFAALWRIFSQALPGLAPQFTTVLWTLSALTMVFGNLLAIAQKNVKRMLAYSSIAHAGYILMAFVPFGNPLAREVALAAGLFYLITYLITNFGAWAVVSTLERERGQGLNLEDYAGLGSRSPSLALAMTIFMLSLTGVPPTLGLIGKFYLFRSVIAAGFYGLAVIGVLTSLISAYYYLRLVVIMYMQPGDPQTSRDPWLNLTWGTMAALTVVLSLVPAPLFWWASQAVLR
uniref:NADH-quinone oxidoreductase subunit N n=1 Tax=uncultured Chloroflexota bacterium TaxID=166587 RepID=H5S8Q7_9CHLR|nr:NADH dehydrogenase I subunit N [uncultured Chloroflexota bacterium]